MSTADDVKTTVIQAGAIPKPVSKEPLDVIRHLGDGGMGEVFLCKNPLYDEEDPHCKEPRVIAVKTLSQDLMQDREVLKRFEAEAIALSPIQHRNVVRLFDWGQFTKGPQTGQHYISMEYIEGLSLHKLGRLRRLSFPDIIDIGIQICEGLVAVHRNNVIHRDLKPANIMITHDGVAKIIDFGIAKPSSLATTESDSNERGFKTKTGMIIGTVNYLAPEILLGAQASVQSDIYAVGLIIWEIINGATPFKTPSVAETMRRVSEEGLPWTDATLDIAPPGFIKLVNQITAKDPWKRPQSVNELVQKLLKVRADAQWPSLLNRRSRLDLNVMWSTTLLTKLKEHSIADEDLLYILQGVEDHLISEKDARLKSGQPIDVEESIITSSLNAFKSARYEAAMARQARLKSELQAAAANPTVPVDRSQKPKTQTILTMGTPPPIAMPYEKGTVSNKLKNTNGSQSKKVETAPINSTSDAAKRLFTGMAAIAVTAGIFYFAVHRFRESLGVRQPADDGTPAIVATPTDLRVQEITEKFKDLKPGLRLIYDAKYVEGDQPPRETQERRDLVAIENGRVIWKINETQSVSTSILAIPTDAYFSSANRAIEKPGLEIANFTRPDQLQLGQNLTWTLKDGESGNVEKTSCQAISKSETMLLGINQNQWRIECEREAINELGETTHRARETYEFVDGSGIITSYNVQVVESKTSGRAARKYTRIGTLNTKYSTFKN